MKRGKPLAQVGRRAKREAEDRAEMRREVIADTGGVCLARAYMPEIRCWGGCEVHELVDRSVRPGVHLDKDYAITTCHAHNSAINDDATRAREVGLTFYSWDHEAARERAADLKRALLR